MVQYTIVKQRGRLPGQQNGRMRNIAWHPARRLDIAPAEPFYPAAVLHSLALSRAQLLIFL